MTALKKLLSNRIFNARLSSHIRTCKYRTTQNLPYFETVSGGYSMASTSTSGAQTLKRELDSETSPVPTNRKRLLLENDATTSMDISKAGGSTLVGDSTNASMDIDAAERELNIQEENGSQPSSSTQKQKAGGEAKETKKSRRGRGGRRNRNEEDAERATTLVDADGQLTPKAPRFPKRLCALLIGFCGSGYSGMQIQPDHTRTIEGVLFNALVKIGAVSQDNADNPVKVGLARAARTDAGVHAAGNLVSLKMIITIPGVKDIVARINHELPPEIRLWGYARVQNSFNARLICESRKYTYFFPSYLLIPPKPGTGLHRALSEYAAQQDVASASTSTDPHEFWKGQETDSKEENLLRKRAWRVVPEQVEKLRELARKYEGTHNFHNFTVGREFSDRSNNRYMRKIEVADPVVYGETEWISILFHGQSFMLHQRKMMSVLVLSCRFGTPKHIINELYGPKDIFIPKMPSLGLLLEEPLFDSYNKRMSVINENLQPTDAEYRPLIDFDIHRDKINTFKEDYIYKNMREVEDRDGLFDAWIRAVDIYSGNDLLYFNPTGTIPEMSLIKTGIKRDNPFREKRVFDLTSFPANGEIKQKLEDDDADVEGELPLDQRQLDETEG